MPRRWDFTLTRDRARFGQAYLEDERRWRTNGGTISNTLDPNGPAWGAFHFDFDFLGKIADVIAEKAVPNGVFVMNERDRPLLRKDMRESYSRAFCWQQEGGASSYVPLLITAEGSAWLSHCHRGGKADDAVAYFAPIYSFYTCADFEDWSMPVETDIIPVPPVDLLDFENFGQK